MSDRDALKTARTGAPARDIARAATPAPPAPAGAMSLTQRVEEEILSGRVELPVMPETALKVREIVARDGTIGEITAVIERDPSLAAEIVRYSNSVAFAGLREISDLSQAVSRLGTISVQQTVLALSMNHVFQSDDPVDARLFRSLWGHSVTTALAARRLATRSPGLSTETTFLAGLLHDIGKVVVMRCASHMRAQDPTYSNLSEAVLFEFFDSLHCRVGETFLRSWNIPEPIRSVVRRHHDAQFAMPADELIVTVSFANKVAASLGASLTPRPEISLLDQHEAELLRLNDLRLANLLVDIDDDIESFRGAF